jgi:hypothetical protein
VGRPGAGPAHALEELEYARLRLLYRAKVAGAVWAGVTLLALAMGVSRTAASICIGVGAVVIAVVVFYFLRSLGVSFKRAVLPSVVAKLAPGLVYQPDAAIEEREFNKSTLFTAPDRYGGSDLFEGQLGGAKVRFSLVEAQEEYTESSTDSEGDRKEETKCRGIFTGMFFVADINRQMSGKTLVVPAGIFSSLSRDAIDLHDPGFAKMFKVTGSSAEQARHIFNPALIERFKALHERLGGFCAAFCHDRVFIAVPMSLGAFQPRLLTPMTDPRQIQAIEATFKSITAIIEDLDLNQQAAFG